MDDGGWCQDLPGPLTLARSWLDETRNYWHEWIRGLAVPFDWASGHWPEIEISDRLTVRLRRSKPITVRPVDFGLDPAGCRDLVLTLRDDRGLRGRLPEFDSALDLSERPVVTGELITPRL